jgi:ribose transport system permease protein
MIKGSPLPKSSGTNRPVEKPASLVTQIMASREISVVIVLALLGVAMLISPVRDKFFSSNNIQNILLQASLLGIFAIGETIVIITGGIDLSLGSLIAFTGMILAYTVTQLDQRMYTGAAVMLGILITLVVSLLIGALHALLIHRVGLPAFVVTLVSLLVLRSQSYVINHHLQILLSAKKYPLFYWLANGKFPAQSTLALPIPAIFVGIVALATYILLSRTRMGRYLYSIGNNEQATMLSGVNVYHVKLFAYGTSALLGGLAGIFWAGYGGQGDPQTGNAYELYAVAASVVGGASLTGGRGSVLGTLLGACLLHAIFVSINLTLNEPSWRDTVVGGVLLLAVLVTALQQRRSRN